MNYSEWDLIKYVFQQKLKNHDNYSLNIFQRWFYIFKTVICILFNRKEKLHYDNSIDAVAIFNGSENPFGYYGTEYDWTEIAVGKGCFKNWQYDIYRNGT